MYVDVQKTMYDAINDLCKHVNQYILLQSLHNTRTCNYLLEPVDNSNDNTSIISNSTNSQLMNMDGKKYFLTLNNYLHVY